jgi:outer membrane receptor for ferrienterochelin and colicins
MTIGRAALVSLLLASGSPLLAQEAASPAAASGARSYTPADFARFAPRNAYDMLRQVPGFVIRQADQERGLGQATGNVLINGQRISGKSNDVLTELGRIPAGNVVRIDIVDGATLDVPGLSGQVANIITKSGGISGQFSWQPDFRIYNTKPNLTRADISVSGKKGPVEYTIGLANNSNHSGAGGPTFIYDRQHNFVEQRDDFWTGTAEAPRISGRFTLDGPGSSVGNLNASYERVYYDYREHGHRYGPGLPDRFRTITQENDSYDYEVGGDYEFALGPGRLKLIGLDRFVHNPSTTSVVTDFADSTPSSGNRFAQVGDTKEQIARAEYRWKLLGGDWQLSGEGAFNSLDNVSRLFELSPGGDFVEIPLDGGSATVKEDRFETMLSYGRPLTPKLGLQISAGGEYSQLRQIGAGGLTRTFWRPKGLFSLAWKPTPKWDVNLKIQRKVGQLNFYDFLASVNLKDEHENAGNPDLVPQQSWEADLETTRNFGAYGTSTLRLYGRRIDDIVDTIPIGLTGESPGNIDRATVYGFEWKGTLNFDPMGWKGAKLDARAWVQWSSLKDPLTGEKRRISNDLIHYFSVTLRHDIPGSDWAWGGAIDYELDSLDYRLTEVGRFWEGPVWASLYVENKDVFGLTVRATAGNILGATSMWDRTIYVNRRTGPVDIIEHRDRIIGPIFSFQVRGKF